MTEEHNTDKKAGGQEDNPLAGYLIFGSLCAIAYAFDVHVGLILIAIIGYIFSRHSG